MKVFNSFQEVLASQQVNNFYGQNIPSLNPAIVPKVGVSITASDLTNVLPSGEMKNIAIWEKIKQDAMTVTGHITGLSGGGPDLKAYMFSFNTGTGAFTMDGKPTVILPVNSIDGIISAIRAGNSKILEGGEKVIWDYVNANLDKIEWRE